MASGNAWWKLANFIRANTVSGKRDEETLAAYARGLELALEDMPHEVVREAAIIWIRRETHVPTPAELRRVAREVEQRFREEGRLPPLPALPKPTFMEETGKRSEPDEATIAAIDRLVEELARTLRAHADTQRIAPPTEPGTTP